MSWNEEKGGYYCDHCGAAICLSHQQSRFGKVVTGDRPGSDPYVSVSRFGFGPGKSYSANLQYCFDCEPLLFAVLKKFNEERNAKLQGDSKL